MTSVHGAAIAWLIDAGEADMTDVVPMSLDQPERMLAVPRPLNISTPDHQTRKESVDPLPRPSSNPSAPSLAGKASISDQLEKDMRTGQRTPQESAVQLARKAKDLASLEKEIAGFRACSLQQTATNTVFSRGAEDAPVMLVGEAPGDEEDRQGKPFVGTSGQLLDEILVALGWSESDVRIGNILPWRPPGNRAPLPLEISLCLPFIKRHIALIAPKIIVCLGGVAAKSLLGRSEGITRLRQDWHVFESEIGPIHLKPTFHPAYLLRSPGQKRLAWADFLAVKHRLATMGDQVSA